MKIYHSESETICKACANGRNCINGRWCIAKRKYVEYNLIKECYEYRREDNDSGGEAAHAEAGGEIPCLWKETGRRGNDRRGNKSR